MGFKKIKGASEPSKGGEKMKKCHWCEKPLKRPNEKMLTHCFECNMKRLESMTQSLEPCPNCKNLNRSYLENE